MSGIAGWMALPRHAPDDAAIAAVLDALLHRGPEAAGACALASATHRVVLGHRRSRIAQAPQPVCDEAAGIALTCEGAAADAVMRAYQRSDTDAMHQLHGGFAFALWDARKQRLMLVRDRFGEKPLYYCESNGSVFFASEAKALLKIPGIRAEADLHAVRELLAYGYVPGPRTLFSGIHKLPAASYVTWQHGRRREVRYWTPPDRLPPAGRAQARAAEEAGFVSELDNAVSARMGDAPAGAFLSGGLGSSTLVAVMVRHQPKVNTFSVALAEARSRELLHAAQVAKHFGTEHHELTVSAEDLVAHLPKLVACRDAPLSGLWEVPMFLLAREAARSTSVLLSGEGGDEVLGGRRRHVAERLGWPFARGDWRSRCLRSAGGLDRGDCDRLAGPLLNGSPVFEARTPFDSAPANTSLRRALYFEQASVLPDNLLERADRLAMAASVEARMPFVDHRIAEYVSALPDTERARALRTRWILRKAAKQLMPRALRRSSGAQTRAPLGEWLRRGMREMLLDHLLGPGSRTRAYYNAPQLDAVLEEHLKGRHNHQELLWTLLNLEIWHRTYRPG